MRGILPWETLPQAYFLDRIEWEFSCLDRSTINPAELVEFWLPDQHDLNVRVSVRINSIDPKAQRVFSEENKAKWILSWTSKGTSLCGSSDLFAHNNEIVEIVCTIPKGSCSRCLEIEPVAVFTGFSPNEDGIFSLPPGAILTTIGPLVINLGEAPVFPLYERSGDGKVLLKWNFLDDLSANLNEDITRLLSVEVDINHPLMFAYHGETDQAKKQKSGLLNHMVVSEYLRVLASDDNIVRLVTEEKFSSGSAGFSIQWLLNEIAGSLKFSSIKDLCVFIRSHPFEASRIVDDAFTTTLLK